MRGISAATRRQGIAGVLPLPGSTVVLRLVGAVVGGAWFALSSSPLYAFAALAVALVVITAAVLSFEEGRRGEAFEVFENPAWVIASDLLALSFGILAGAGRSEPILFLFFVAPGVEAAFALGPGATVAVFGAFAVVRVANEMMRSPDAFDPNRFALELALTGLLVVFLATLVDHYAVARRRAGVLERLAASFDAPEPDLAQRVTSAALAVIHADYAVLRHRVGSTFPIVAATGQVPERRPTTLKLGAAAEALRLGRTVQIEDYQHFANANEDVLAAGVRVAMATPVSAGGNMLACLIVGRYTPVPFDGADRAMVEALAGHASVALKNARLLAHARQLETLSRELALEGDEGRLLQRVADASTQLLACEFALVAWLEAGKEGVRAASGVATEWWESVRGSLERRRPRGGLLGQVSERGERVIVDDYLTWPGNTAPADSIGLRAVIGEPITVDGAVMGALVIGTTAAGRTFRPEEIDLADALAAHASVAVRNAQHRAERERRLARVARLNEAARQLAGVRDLRQLYRLVYESTAALVPVDAFYLALYDPERRAHNFVLQVEQGREREQDVVAPMGSGPTSDVVRTGQTQVRLQGDGGTTRFGDLDMPTLSAVHVPLRLGERMLGVLSAQRYVEGGYGDEEVATLETLASHAAAAIENLQLLIRTRELYLASVRALAAAVDARDPYTRSHSARTSALARAIAEDMGLAAEDVRKVQLAGLLHDVGKIGIPDAVLNKPGPFTAEERLIMMTHAALGGAILQSVEPLRELVPIVQAHHERYDGTGYPDRLAGDGVPLAAYIVAAADAFEVIVSKRAYKEAQSIDYAIEELRRFSGTQFHPAVVDAFVRVIERDRSRGASYLRRLGRADYEELESEIPGPATLVQQFAATAQRHMRQLAILQRIASEITAVLDIDSLANRLMHIVCDAMAYEDGFLLTLDPATEELIVRAAVGSSAEHLGLRLARGQGVSWDVLETGRPLNIRDVREHVHFYGPADIRSTLVVPLILGEERIGVLGVESPRAGAFDDEDVQLLSTVSHQLAAAVRVARLHQEVKTAAATDSLTGLANRRAFFEMLEAVVTRAKQASQDLAIAVVDVNGLKKVNDTLGHLAGDAALVRIGQTLASGVREQDLVARYGGDEFALIFPGASLLEAERVMRRLAEKVRSDGEASGASVVPTIAWGLAAMPSDGETVDQLLEAADRAMYRHKAAAAVRARLA